MQILDLLSSTANVSGATSIPDAKVQEAFSKHLDEVIAHRTEMRSEDADRANEKVDRPERRELADDARRDTEAPEEVDGEESVQRRKAADDAGKEQKTTENSADGKATANSAVSETILTELKLAAAFTANAADANIPGEGQAVDGSIVAAVATDLNLKSENSGQPLVKDSGQPLVNDSGQPATNAARNNTDVLQTALANSSSDQTDSNAKTNQAATQANPNAAFLENQQAKAQGVVSENAGPFTADGDEAVVAAVVAEEVKVVGPETTDDTVVVNQTELPETAALAATAATVQGGKKVDEVRSNSSKPENAVDDQSGDEIAAEVPVDGSSVNTDARLQAMRLAEAHQENANAENIYQRFVVANNGTASVQGQMVSAQVAAQAQANTTQGRPLGSADNKASASETSPAPTPTPAANAIAKPVAPPALSSAPSSDQNAGSQPSLGDRSAAVLAQLANSAKDISPFSAQLKGAAQGPETAATTGNTSPTPTVASADNALNATSQTAAARSAPAARSAQQPPQVQVAVQIAKAVKNGADRISIRLNPSELGRVDVKIEVSADGKVAAAITVERPETLELLKADSRMLQRALADAGLETKSDDLSFSLRDQNAGENRLANEGNQKPSSDDPENDPLQADDDVDIDAILASARASSDRALDINV